MNSSKHFNLIIPAASDKGGADGKIPQVFTFNSEGVMHCIESIMGLNLDAFDHIYFVVLRKHVEAFDVDTLLALQLRRLGLDKAQIIVLPHPTDTQAETIATAIKTENIAGPVFIKDADCYFKAEVWPENSVAVFPLEELTLVDPRHKSYVAVDDMQHITNIIEKRVVSHLFNAGGYGFENAAEFIEYFEKYRHMGNLYLSHLIYAMLLDGFTFRPIRVSEYQDWAISCNS